jgi:chromosome segregation protein
VEILDGILSGLRTDQRSAEQKRSVAESRFRESESRISERNDRLTNLVENIRETREHREELDRQRLRTQWSLCESRLALGRAKEELSTYEDLRSETRLQRDELSEKLDEVNEKLREREKTIEQVRGTIEKTESERSNQQARRSELVGKIEDELEIQPAEKILEVEETDPDRDRDTIASRVRTLKSEIRDRQPVNMLASEEAEELEQEVTEVQSQYDDLQDSCGQLESLIDRLNDKARKQFREAFDEIQDYFEDHIEELFQGGRGTMELTDDPVLQAGVKFEIEPPGEQLRTMSALSGGEKTLGALGFLFALYERKSTPFCFLDEVDHPLDDENVHQFIRLLSRYREKTQFIVITHNKLTMQATDKLFGVTMEESGVTSIVPMELEDAEDLREPREVG